MLIQQRALEEDGWICHATITPYFIITPPCLPVDLSLKLFPWFSFMWREPNSSTQSETDSILLNSECFCKHSQPSFPFSTQRPFLVFLSILLSRWSVSPDEPASTSSLLPPLLLFLSSESAFPLRSYYPATCRVQAAALRPYKSTIISCLHPPPSSSSPVLSLTVSLLVLKDVDVHSFDLAPTVLIAFSWSKLMFN